MFNPKGFKNWSFLACLIEGLFKEKMHRSER